MAVPYMRYGMTAYGYGAYGGGGYGADMGAWAGGALAALPLAAFASWLLRRGLRLGDARPSEPAAPSVRSDCLGRSSSSQALSAPRPRLPRLSAAGPCAPTLAVPLPPPLPLSPPLPSPAASAGRPACTRRTALPAHGASCCSLGDAPAKAAESTAMGEKASIKPPGEASSRPPPLMPPPPS
jgi:hypothetical protein